MTIPKLALSDNNQIPIIGLGTSLTSGQETIKAVKDAIDVGYRHIDCAYCYGNEKYVGFAINDKITEGVVKREDLFITSKLWNSYHRSELVEYALHKSLTNLGLDYVDLYLMHWPMAETEEDPLIKFGDTFNSDSYDYIDTWKAMEKLKRKGLTKSIGISNFNKQQILRILEVAEILPTINQVERHPYLSQSKLVKFCHSKGIQIVGYCPLATPARYDGVIDYPKLLEEPTLKELSFKYSKSPAQIALKWQIQNGIVVIPKSIHKERILENIDLFNFEITMEDMEIINKLNSNLRILKFVL